MSESDFRYRTFFEGMYDWFANISRGAGPIDDETVARWWNHDSRMIQNGRAEAIGIELVRKHYEQFPINFSALDVRRPLVEYLEVGDRVAIEYIIDARDLAGKSEAYRVIAIFALHRGRIQESHEVSALEEG